MGNFVQGAVNKSLEKCKNLLYGSARSSYFSYILKNEQNSKMFVDNLLLAVYSKRIYIKLASNTSVKTNTVKVEI